MSPRRFAWTLWAVTLLLFAAAIAIGVSNRTFSEDLEFKLMFVFMAPAYATVGALLASRHPRNALGWLFLALPLGLSLGVFTEEYVQYGLVTSPGSLPLTTPLAWFSNWQWILSFLGIPLIILLFPTGRVPSPRWRIVLWILVVGGLSGVVGTMISPDPMQFGDVRIPNPLAVPGVANVFQTIGTAALLGSLLAVVALFMRFRRARGEERQQIRWFAYVAIAAGVFFLGALVTEIFSSVEDSTVGVVSFYGFIVMFALGIPIAAGVSILKYRLYDLDIVIKKTVVFGALAGFITLVYVAIVVGIGAAVGGGRSRALTFLGAAIVAIAFQPARNLARHLANRLVYGKRATPYEVLAEFSDRMAGAYSTDDVLPRMAQITAAGTGALRAEVWLRVGSSLRIEAGWPNRMDEESDRLTLQAEDLPAFPPGTHAVPVRHRGELLGAISVQMPPSDPLTPDKEKLVSDLASQAGLALRNVRLTEELKDLVEELRASRQRIVATQDARAKKLERDLHDGAQQQLVALSVKVGLAKSLARRDPDRAEEMMAEVQGELRDALESLRDLARGIYPPVLADQGLVPALTTQARKAPLPVEIHGDGIGRYPQEAEAAVYFCCLEALQNVAKYARASRVDVRLNERNGDLLFEVVDDGIGFDLESAAMGTGLQGMADRIAALGGSLDVHSRPGEGTRVVGRLPVADRAEQPLLIHSSG